MELHGAYERGGVHQVRSVSGTEVDQVFPMTNTHTRSAKDPKPDP